MGTGTSRNLTSPISRARTPDYDYEMFHHPFWYGVLVFLMRQFFHHRRRQLFDNKTTQTDQAEPGPSASLTPRRVSDHGSNETNNYRRTSVPSIVETVSANDVTAPSKAGSGKFKKDSAPQGSAHDVPVAARSKDGSGQFVKDSAPQDTVTGQRDLARNFNELPIQARAEDLSEQFKNDTAPMDAVTGQHDDNRYPTDGRGYLLLINFGFGQKRHGSENDVKRIKKFFSETLNFEIEHKPDSDEVKEYIKQMNNNTIDNAKAEVRKDDTAQKASDEVYKKSDNDNKYSNKADVQTKKAMQDMDRNTLLEYLKTLKTHIKPTYYCFVCIIMAHGFKHGIYTRMSTDETELMKEAVLITEITDLFDNTSMTQLAGKPKIFIFNSCRGNKEALKSAPDTKEKRDLQKDGYDGTAEKLPRAYQYSDFAECYSTVPDYISLRDTCLGAVYIQKCMNVFENNFDKCDMLEMITSVNRGMQKKDPQVAQFVSTLTRKLYLVKFQE